MNLNSQSTKCLSIKLKKNQLKKKKKPESSQVIPLNLRPRS